ncbi:hypothetical protein BZG29_18390 [Janthinobacterium sp. LM6]|uniref:hypothetical protein n=1 Tax=Janthinobacterium sp. LM6 TaxID=1938606 RepID=UPI000983C44B|nr:hypothetical protein [Janthinobacterium sp. LM6]AQR70077.1 hypothetical protein BZG29_18390 [Janthinobacterium sp. LM6]
MKTSTRSQIDAAIVLDAPFVDIHIAYAAAPEHAHMRARQLAALLRAMQPEEGPDDLLWLAQQMADEVAGTLAGIEGGAP